MSEGKGGFKGEKSRIKKWKCPSAGLEHSMPGLQFDAYLVDKVVEVHYFVPDLKVGRFMPVVIDHTTLLFY